ncbi:Protein ZBED8 [Thelohanellus kitauei]|uniref:Protein ZBED8 n=1 Tax=Thelohanellus kitauei TaxID=669202 RepID=A0A0C2MH19_THEKT|nr:Protein ZBED8 [Thelohanellus kitauei]
MALRMARVMKPHTIVDKLLFPAAEDIVRVMIGEEFVNKLNGILIPNDAVRRRIADMSADNLDQIIEKTKSPFLTMVLQACYDAGLDFIDWHRMNHRKPLELNV